MVVRLDNKAIDARHGIPSSMEVRRAESPQASPQPPAAKPSAPEVSSLSAKLVAIERELSANSPYDKKKVEAIKQQVRDGVYQINPDNIADKIVDSAIAYSRNKR